MTSNATVTGLHCIADLHCSLGEAPVWSESAQTLYWLDVAAPAILYGWHYQTRQVRRWALPELATGLSMSESDELVVLAQSGINVFDIERCALRNIVGVPFAMTGIRFNDCGCDRSGQLWTGIMRNDFSRKQKTEVVEAPPDFSGRMCCFNDQGVCRLVATDIECPNTFVWSLDGTTLYTADSSARCLYSYRFDSPSGAVGVRSVFSAHVNLGVPDGSALDAEGCLWNARWGAGCVVRFQPDGSVANIVRIPANLVTSCAFGGDALDTLFVTTASYDLQAHELALQPKSGGVFAFKPGVPGARRPGFRINRQEALSPASSQSGQSPQATRAID